MRTPMSHILRCLGCLLLSVLAVHSTGSAQSEQRIPGTNVKYTFPSKWKYLKTTEIDKNTSLYLFCYKQQTVVSQADTALPYLCIYVRKDCDKQLPELVFERFMQQPYQTLDEYLTGPGLPTKGGMGYVGLYTHPKNNKEYAFRMVYFKEGSTAIEFRLETTRATYPQMEAEFVQILKSLTF